MRLVFVITKSEIGGAQTWVNQLRLSLANVYEIYLITSEKGWLTDQFTEGNVFIIPGIASLTKPFTIFEVQSILKSIKADVVVSSSANAGLYARLARIFYPHKSIYVSHGWSCLYNGGRARYFLSLVERALSYISDVVLCVSETDKVKACEIIGIKKDRVEVIRNCTIPQKIKSEVNIKKKILYLGRMVHPKRPHIIAEVVSTIPEVELHFIGGGEYLSSMKNVYGEFSNITFHGEVMGFCDFNKYDIFVLCSDSEGLPMSALEAASAGVPLLMSDVGGCHELIHSDLMGNKNGELFSNDTEDLRSKLNLIVDDYSNYYSVAIMHKDDFSIAKNIDRYIHLFKK